MIIDHFPNFIQRIIKKFDIPCATNFSTQLKLPNFSEEVIVNVSEDFHHYMIMDFLCMLIFKILN